MNTRKRRKSESQEMLEYAQMIKAFCEKKEIIECLTCKFNDREKGCLIRKPSLWDIPRAKRRKE